MSRETRAATTFGLHADFDKDAADGASGSRVQNLSDHESGFGQGRGQSWQLARDSPPTARNTPPSAQQARFIQSVA